nr:beta-galactosidase [uncultured Cohaesibacter sp.]
MKKTSPKDLSVWRPINLDDFIMGVPYYPEHVDESTWEEDAIRMAEAGFNTVRMGEFAWHLWEPYQGHFEFDLFDRAIELLGRYGIKTILCTPTATPPRWLTAAHPEVLRVDANGRTASHGSRQHCDTTSPVLRDHSRRITLGMAEHYKTNADVIGWQTDNELNTTASLSFSESCQIEFKKWCHLKYGEIDALNDAWGGAFWATSYDNFDQLVLPFPMAPGQVSPGHRQDYHRFLADATASFQRDQVEILRQANSDWFVFHNLGVLEDMDLRGSFAEDLDFMGYDVYPMLHDEMQRNGGHVYTQALHLDWFRAYSGNFIVPEQTSGLGSQPTFSTMNPEPGEMRRMAFSSVARGADGLMFFRWKPAHFGAEIYWMGLIDHDNVARRRYDEAKHFASDIAGLKQKLLGTSVRMDVGIAGVDYDNQEAYRTYPMGLPSPKEDGILLHKELYVRGIATGFIHPSDELSRLKALYVPHFMMWDTAWSANCRKFVEGGGTLIVSALSATRTRDNHIHTELAPGDDLSDLMGVRVEEFGRVAAPGTDGLFESPASEEGFSPAGQKRKPGCSVGRQYLFREGNTEFQAAHLYEKLILQPGTDAMAEWSTRFLESEPAMTVRHLGTGQAIYLATYLTEEIAAKLADILCQDNKITPLLAKIPDGIEVTERFADDGRRMLFVINTTESRVDVAIPFSTKDLLTGTEVSSNITLDAYGVSVLEL